MQVKSRLDQPFSSACYSFAVVDPVEEKEEERSDNYIYVKR